MTFAEQFSFLCDWATNPLRVGAIAPSSQSLADIITSEITVRHAPIIELGPGTGVFTRHLIQRGVPESKLALVESGDEFARLLAGSFPEADVLCMDACGLDRVRLFDGQLAGAVVSGLPLAFMSPEKVTGVLESAFFHLRPGGSLYQFTYGLRGPVSRSVLDRCGLRAKRIGGTLNNMPPASVYKFSRQKMQHA